MLEQEQTCEVNNSRDTKPHISRVRPSMVEPCLYFFRGATQKRIIRQSYITRKTMLRVQYHAMVGPCASQSYY